MSKFSGKFEKYTFIGVVVLAIILIGNSIYEANKEKYVKKIAVEAKEMVVDKAKEKYKLFINKVKEYDRD